VASKTYFYYYSTTCLAATRLVRYLRRILWNAFS